MTKILILISFLGLFGYLIKKDRVYWVPLVLLIYTSINGLLQPDDFAIRGLIKLFDYGSLISIFLILHYLFESKYSQDLSDQDYIARVKKSPLFVLLLLNFFLYFLIFIFSAYYQNTFEWAIKEGRFYLKGCVVFLMYFILKNDPLKGSQKIMKFLLYSTFFFGVLYIIYNLFGINFYALEAGIATVGGSRGIQIPRNFYGFPALSSYFVIYIANQIYYKKGKLWFNYLALVVFFLSIALSYTRGLVMTAVLSIFIALFDFKSIGKSTMRIGLIVLIVFITAQTTNLSHTVQYKALMERFTEFNSRGMAGSDNFKVRSEDFWLSVEKVLDFNPFIGFGFMNIETLGYKFVWAPFAGSPDNTYTNLIGITGFAGLFLYLLIILAWLIINIRLVLLKKYPTARANLLFIFNILILNNNHARYSYLDAFCFFMISDLMIYYYFISKNECVAELTEGKAPISS